MFLKRSGLFRNFSHRYLYARSCSTGKDTPTFPQSRSEFTTNLKFLFPQDFQGIPVYRVLDRNGALTTDGLDIQLNKEFSIKMLKTMTLLNTMDRIMYDSQRQGRISFYMTHYGEEGVQIGSAAAIDKDDLIFGQYREAGVGLWRGFTLDEMLNQCYGNKNDSNKGKQMPIHYANKDLNYFSISSVLGTQMPHAVGAAYAFKRAQNGKCTICYFGDGASSVGDAHAAMNFSATLECPVIFLCRNNGYAISTPLQEQYRGDGIGSRGLGYGIPTIRVDGNDIIAVYNAVKAAKHLCITENRPVLVETMTYRIGAHSTSDDGFAYRSVEEVSWWDKNDNPILRFKMYLFNKKWWSEQEEEQWRNETRKMVIQAVEKAEKVSLPNPLLMFQDVLDEIPKRLRSQMTKQYRFLKRNKDRYPTEYEAPEKIA